MMRAWFKFWGLTVLDKPLEVVVRYNPWLTHFRAVIPLAGGRPRERERRPWVRDGKITRGVLFYSAQGATPVACFASAETRYGCPPPPLAFSHCVQATHQKPAERKPSAPFTFD